MIYNYTKFLNESLNKIDFLRNKYKDISDKDFNILVDAVPSTNKQYLDWILKCYNNSDDKKVYIEDAYKIKEYLSLFTEYKNKNRIVVKDINKYKDYKDLYKTLSEIGGLGKPTEDEHYLIDDRYYINNKEAELFYEDDNYLIVIPKTLSASKFYAKNTEWCTQYPDNFKKYSEQGNLYIIIDIQLLNTADLNRRLQFHFESEQFMNFNDEILLANIKSKFLNIFKEVKDNWKLKYDYIDNFNAELAMVQLNGKWGFIDTSGKEICEIRYDWVYNFKNGFAIVKLNNKFGFINEQGKEICPIKYDNYWPFDNGFARIILNDKFGFINEQGKEICDIKYNFAYDFENGFSKVRLNKKWGFINEQGKEICDIKYDMIETNFVNGFAEVELNDNIFYIDEQGNEYDEIPNK
jgi:hypothetical protein